MTYTITQHLFAQVQGIQDHVWRETEKNKKRNSVEFEYLSQTLILRQRSFIQFLLVWSSSEWMFVLRESFLLNLPSFVLWCRSLWNPVVSILSQLFKSHFFRRPTLRDSSGWPLFWLLFLFWSLFLYSPEPEDLAATAGTDSLTIFLFCFQLFWALGYLELFSTQAFYEKL